MAQVGFLFGATKPFAALSLRLLFITLFSFLSLARTGSLMLSDSCRFRLLVGCSLGEGLLFSLFSLALLLALYFGILGSIP